MEAVVLQSLGDVLFHDAGLLELAQVDDELVRALAVRAAEADTAAERYRELLKERQRRLADMKRRARERAEWEALAVLLTPPPRQ